MPAHSERKRAFTIVAFESQTRNTLEHARDCLTRHDPAAIHIDALLSSAIANCLPTAGADAAKIRFVLALDEAGEVRALAGVSGAVILSSGPEDAFAAIGEFITTARTGPDDHGFAEPRFVSGSPDAVTAFLNGMNLRADVLSAKVTRFHDIMLLRREELRSDPGVPGINVVPATLQDFPFVSAGYGELVQAELGYDPRRRSEFAFRLRTQIRAGRWWIGRYANDPYFLAAQGVHNAGAMVLENIWVKPQERGHGLGTSALRHLLGALFEQTPRVVLTVAAGNARAIGVYQRLGFTRIGERRSDLFPRVSQAG